MSAARSRVDRAFKEVFQEVSFPPPFPFLLQARSSPDPLEARESRRLPRPDGMRPSFPFFPPCSSRRWEELLGKKQRGGPAKIPLSPYALQRREGPAEGPFLFFPLRGAAPVKIDLRDVVLGMRFLPSSFSGSSACGAPEGTHELFSSLSAVIVRGLDHGNSTSGIPLGRRE